LLFFIHQTFLLTSR